ncbi:MAG: sulfatase-like hydrolase/transferase [Chloroflexi bacterium]|nr:sulfatase-like hydrolase/transferase [Chloroflexota bacterium]
MNRSISRREFLKMMALLPPSLYVSRFLQEPERIQQDQNVQNVIIVLFDTLSAKNISLYGYPRDTMPNLARVAEKATVYHNHYSGGNWTTPGTASLLTGTYPWTHRAINELGTVIEGRERNNIFNLFDQYYRLGYSHNTNVYRFFDQFAPDMDFIEKQKDLFIANNLSFDRLFPNDGDIAPLSWDRMVEEGEKGSTYSLFFAPLYDLYRQSIVNSYADDFPRGLPHTGEDDYFILEDGINWMLSQIETIRNPFLGYFHYLPPHRPYNTRHEFVDAFKGDGIRHYIEKPRRLPFGGGIDKPQDFEYQAKERRDYDEFILYADSEFGRLYDTLEKNGALENTWFVFTSDHGELFERGIFGHRTPVLYQPVIQIPLVIVEPGQRERRDVYTPTSAVDVLPTLLKVTGQEIPAWVEGEVLPPFSGTTPSPDRSIYAVEATKSDKTGPLNPATVMLVKGRYKLTAYLGYKQLGADAVFELYDLENDPEELTDIYDSASKVAQELRDELLAKVKEVDRPYLK